MNACESYFLLRQRCKKRILKIPVIVILSLALLLSICTAILLYVADHASTPPTWDEAIRMDDATLLEAIGTFSRADLVKAWGDPITETDADIWDEHYLVWKSEHSLDHIYVYLNEDTKTIKEVSVVYVFEALPIFVGDDYSWATVTPCSGEDELIYGDILKINLVGRRAVFDSMHEAPDIPVRVYYKGMPHAAANGEYPYIDTVIDVNYFDYSLEPIQDE